MSRYTAALQLYDAIMIGCFGTGDRTEGFMLLTCVRYGSLQLYMVNDTNIYMLFDIHEIQEAGTI